MSKMFGGCIGIVVLFFFISTINGSTQLKCTLKLEPYDIQNECDNLTRTK